ncbi:MAG: hypothetical protein PHQ96_09415 [Candidatus Omnitrophica bacterium]|nr:hypothetical protein [Candidatus Omnitrophota bacterium]
MKKITVLLIALVFLCGMNVLSFAQTAQNCTTKKAEGKHQYVKGKILSIDTAKNEIVIKKRNDTKVTIGVDPKIISALNKDEEVRITLKAGSENTAEHIEKITRVIPPVAKTK